MSYYAEIHRMEESKRKHYTRLLLSQSKIEDFMGILVYIRKYKSAHIRFIKDSLIIRTHVEGLLRRAKTRKFAMTLDGVMSALQAYKIAPEITEEITALWANEDNERDKIAMYYKLKGEEYSPPLCTEFTFLPRVV